jgi:hypothetical protein
MMRRRAYVVEVVPDLEVAAGETLEVPVEQDPRYLTASTKRLSRSRLSSVTISGYGLAVC